MTAGMVERLHAEGYLGGLDLHLARFLSRRAGEGPDGEALALAAALASRAAGEGHICLDLEAVAGKRLPPDEPEGAGRAAGGPAAPPLDEWVRRLLRCGAVCRPGGRAPLVLDGTRLYLHRLWEQERDLAARLGALAAGADEPVDEARLAEGLRRLFPAAPGGEGETDWQKAAACAAVLRRFCVVSGGPGTGKTTTTARVLALLVEQAAGAPPPRIALAAPTGKAAARMQEAVTAAAAGLAVTEETRRAITGEASTLHRLLGVARGSPRFRHDEENPLPVDVMVVDEASMVDLALMSRLARALPASARLVLLGDKDQLASVEAGNVLGDICNAGGDGGAPLPAPLVRRIGKIAGCAVPGAPRARKAGDARPCVVQLRRSYRFGPDSGIAALAAAVRDGDAARAAALLEAGGFPDVTWRPLPPPGRLAGELRGAIVEGFGPYLAAGGREEKLSLLDRFRLLSPLRGGPWGVGTLCEIAEEVLAGEGLIVPSARWYEGRPVMVTRNDYGLRLFNGDVGLVLHDPAAGGQPRAFFAAPGAPPRRFLPLRLPEHETLFATTVHKSQGSELDRVLLVLPDRDTPLLTRELVYTALTRARRGVEVVAPLDVFAAAVARRTARASGLRDALWG